MLNAFQLTSLVAQAAPAGEVVMTPAGWAIMIVSLSAVLLLNVFCFYRVLALPPETAEGHLKAPLEIDTGDLSDPD